jgi:hypothetical protein
MACDQHKLRVGEAEVLLIWMPMMAKIVHTAKQIVNAIVESRLWSEGMTAALAAPPNSKRCFAGDLDQEG